MSLAAENPGRPTRPPFCFSVGQVFNLTAPTWQVENLPYETSGPEARPGMPRDKVILAYSGGLDTSVMLPWIGEKYNLDVVAFTVDLGQGEDIERIRQKALRTGAVEAIALDARNLFVDCFVWPALMAGAGYQGKDPLATAPGRPLIPKLMGDAAPEHGA